MTTGGGIMNASNLTITTEGGSSAAIRSDRGGGTVNVSGGSYTTSGTGSPAIYSTATITVANADLTANVAQGVVIEGANSVTLTNCDVVTHHTSLNGQDSSYNAVMIYQSGSGDASSGKGTFTMSGGNLTFTHGTGKDSAYFFVTNTAADITLNDATIESDTDDVFFCAEEAAWGTEGSRGGKVNFYANDQTMKGDFVVGETSILNLYMKENTSFTGAVNSEDSGGQIYVEIEDGSEWTLTADSYIDALTCSDGCITLNGHTLTVGSTTYTSGASTGSAITITTSTNSSNGGGSSTPPAKPGE